MAISRSRVLVTYQPPVPTGSHTEDATISAATTLTQPAGANAVLIQAETQNIRYTLDGSTPTATLGFIIEAGKKELIDVPTSGMTIKIIEEAASAKASWQWLVY